MNIPVVNKYEFYFKTAYAASQKVNLPKTIPRELRQNIKDKESAKIFYSSLYNQLTAVITHFPKIEALSKFYTELVDTVVSIDDYKKSLGALNWARFMIKKLYYQFLKKKLSLKDYYGRANSVLKQVSKEFSFLETARKKFGKFPSVKNYPTVLLTGFPNVGKTSLLAKLTESRPEINSYPFTTKNINVGIMKIGNYKIQVIDTPGLLERPLEKRNVIEMKAIIALKYLADLILFIFDTSGASGFTVKQQEGLYNDIVSVFSKSKIFTVTNKSELDKSKKTDFHISCKTGEGISELKEFIRKKLLKS
ncbi:MAG: 50S ribosome-binding GTPase [Nanoarchaeota archaeon]|nr:50S ribosome-binding GTPase [Nanoarchaeota archaeon]